MFIYIEIVKTERFQREKNENQKQLNNNYKKNINNEKQKIKDKSVQHPVFLGGHPSKY